jgi:ABC-type sulfate transport system permease component
MVKTSAQYPGLWHGLSEMIACIYIIFPSSAMFIVYVNSDFETFWQKLLLTNAK